MTFVTERAPFADFNKAVQHVFTASNSPRNGCTPAFLTALLEKIKLCWISTAKLLNIQESWICPAKLEIFQQSCNFISFAGTSQQNWYLISKAVYSTVLLVMFNIAEYIKQSLNFFSRALIFTDLLVNTRKAGIYRAKLSEIPLYFALQESGKFIRFITYQMPRAQK